MDIARPNSNSLTFVFHLYLPDLTVVPETSSMSKGYNVKGLLIVYMLPHCMLKGQGYKVIRVRCLISNVIL